MCVCVCVCMCICVCVCVRIPNFSLLDRPLISLVYLSLGYKVVQATPFDFSLGGFFVQQAIRSTLLSPSSSRGLFLPRSQKRNLIEGFKPSTPVL